MTQFWNFLQGKKTYIVCISGILTALIAFLNGTITGDQFIQAIFQALAAMGIRHGMQ